MNERRRANPAAQFAKDLRSLSFPHAFNPYTDRCPVFDRANAAKARARILALVLAAAMEREIHALWLGRDLGWRGGRRTGLAFTDDIHFDAHLARFGLQAPRPTKGEPLAERTAAILWSELRMIDAGVFLWNVFPLHPHLAGAPFSNRAHNAREGAAGGEILAELIRLLRPKRIVAIGADAASSAARIAPHIARIGARHPSFGGRRAFLEQIGALRR